MGNFLSDNWRQVKKQIGLGELEDPLRASRHLLDLKRGRGRFGDNVELGRGFSGGNGGLGRRFFDLPGVRKDPDLLYLRKRERWAVPPSYRSGLVFFVTVMLVAMMGIVAIDAQTLAEARHSSLDDQITQNFSKLSEELSSFGSFGVKGPGSNPATGTGTQGNDVDFSSLKNNTLVFNADSFSSPVLVQSTVNEQTELVEIGLEISNGYQSFEDFVDSWKAEDLSSLMEKLDWMNRSAGKTVEVWNDVLERSELLPWADLNGEKYEALRQSLNLIAELAEFLNDFVSGFDTLMALLGADEPQRVLLFIQDPYEKRGTGGALSVGVEILLDDGEILKYEPFLASDYDRELRVELAIPDGMSEVSEYWDLETANTFVDVKDSADKIHWFWQREARSSADLVVLINSTVFERLFGAESVLAPLLPEEALEAKFWALKWSARNYNEEGEELKALAMSMLDNVKVLLKSPEMLLKSWSLLSDLVSEKQIMMASTNPETQAQLQDFGLSPSLPSPEAHEDVLMVASLNVRRNGADRLINEALTLHTSVKEDGKIRHWLKIERVFGDEAGLNEAGLDEAGLDDDTETLSLDEKIDFPMTRTTRKRLSTEESKSLIKIYVPRDSVLTQVENVAMEAVTKTNDGAYTIWSFEHYMRPGDVAELGFFYELPWSFDVNSVDNYRLTVVKQPGSETVPFEHQIKLPAMFSIFQQLPAEPIEWLDRDLSIAVVAGRNP